MKYKSKDLSKFAWPSRLTAPVIKVDLIIQCRRLPKKDLLSQADAFCVLWQIPSRYTPPLLKGGMPAKLPSRQETEIGRTEIARASVDPTFNHKFRLDYKFQEEQMFVIRVYDEDLRYATDLKEHDYLGGCVFTLGQLLGAKGCTIPKRLGFGKAFLVITGEEIVETREVLEFRFSCQDLVKQQSVINQSKKVLDKSNPYFRVEKLNKDDQSWEVVWKSEVIKDSLCPTWKVARLPLQLLCNDDSNNRLKVTIWDYERHSQQHDQIGHVESSVAELVEKAKIDGIPVFKVWKEKRKWFGGSKPKRVGLMKVLKANKLNIPSMLQYLSGGCSLDLVMGIDCSMSNGTGAQGLHCSASHWLNDYQAGIQQLGSILEHFTRGRHSSMWGFGGKIDGQEKPLFLMDERLGEAKEMLKSYDRHILENGKFEQGAENGVQLKQLIQKGMFRSIKASQKRQSYAVLCIFTAGNVLDLQESVDLICTAAEDAPLSIIIIGVGNRDFSAIERICGNEKGPMRDSRGVPIARDIVHFVSFKRFAGNASEVVADALKDMPEQFVQYFLNNGTKPEPVIPPPDFSVNPQSPPPVPAERKKKSPKSRANKVKDIEAKKVRRQLLRDNSTYL